MIDVDTVNRFKDGHLLKHYLLASYCYYVLDHSPLTDHAFDRLCVRLLERYDYIDQRKYPHMKIVTKGNLEAGTCLLQANQYPRIVTDFAEVYLEKCLNRTILTELEPHLAPAMPKPQRIMRRPPPVPSVPPPPVRAGRILRTPRKE